MKPTEADRWQTFTVTVEFTVVVEPNQYWTPEGCARDYVRHVIDEGYREALRDVVLWWDFSSIKERESLTDKDWCDHGFDPPESENGEPK